MIFLCTIVKFLFATDLTKITKEKMMIYFLQCLFDMNANPSRNHGGTFKNIQPCFADHG